MLHDFLITIALLIVIYDFFSLCSQPGKLAEAFKYFVQGMGYSKCHHKTPVVSCDGTCHLMLFWFF